MGCRGRQQRLKLIEDAAHARGVTIDLEKVENIADIMAYGVMATPGVVVDGKASVQEVGEQIFELILKTASGQPSKSEIFGYGDDEFAPWVLGPTM